MFRRLLLLAAPLGVVLAFTAAVLPTVQPGPAGPPPTASGQVALSTAGQTLGPGWTAAAAGTTNLVGVQWDGDHDARFAVEARDAQGRWSTAATIGAPDFGPDPGSSEARRARSAEVSEPVWVGDAREVRVRLVVGGTAVRHVVLHSVVAPKEKPAAGVAAAALPWPNVISRAQWGADESLRLTNCPGGPQYDSRVQLAIVHHTVNSNSYGPGDSAAIVRAIYAYHTQTLGYCDIAYNFLVDRYGQVFEGRYGGVTLPVHGAHAIGFNTNTTGVAMIGNFDLGAPPPAGLSALASVLSWKLAVSGVDPAAPVRYTTLTGNSEFAPGTTLSTNAIIGHRDTWFTDCPGTFLYGLLPQVRADVVARVWNALPDSFAGWQPQGGVPKVLAINAFGGLYPAGGEAWLGLPSYWQGWPITRAVALRPDGSGYVLDGWGGIHPFGGAPPLLGGAYWPGWDIARDLVLAPGGGGYVLDAWGGVHPVGGAPPLSGGPYWPGWDIARKVAIVPGGGYVLDAWGGVHAFAGAPGVVGPYWPGRDVARDLVAAPGGPGLYLLDSFGGVWALGGAPPITGAPYFGYDFARGLAVPVAGGGYVLDGGGGVTAFGAAPPVAAAARPVFARGLAAVP